MEVGVGVGSAGAATAARTAPRSVGVGDATAAAAAVAGPHAATGATTETDQGAELDRVSRAETEVTGIARNPHEGIMTSAGTVAMT